MSRAKYRTDIETIMENALKTNNIEHIYEYGFRSKYGYLLDFAIPEIKLGIECDGECWHKEGNLHDKRKDGFLKSLGWKILRFRGEQIKNNIQECIKIIMEEIENEKIKSKN